LALQFPIAVRFTVIKIEFTPEEIDALEYERYHYPDPKVQKKMEVLYLKSQKVGPQDICRLCRLSEPTLVAYLKQYQEGGIEPLKKTGIRELLANWTNTRQRWKPISKNIHRAR
jgi:Homeodomain-like domain